MILETALTLEHECAFLDDDPSLNEVCGIKVLGRIGTLANHCSSYNYCICALGNNKLREKYDTLAKSLGYEVSNIINKTAYVSAFAKLGAGVILFNNVCIQNNAILGDGVVVTANSEIHHDCEIGDYSLIYSCSTIRTFAKLDKRVRIGSTVTVSNEAQVADDSIIKDGETIS